MAFKLEEYKDEKGKLAAYAWPGGYPIYYLTKDSDVLCPKCATEFQDEIEAADANWEDPELFCDECSERIESAYAEDENE